MWEEVTSTLAEEFSSLPDAAEVTRVMVRLLLAALLGGIVGYEREHKGKAAGLRTHMLVSLFRGPWTRLLHAISLRDLFTRCSKNPTSSTT